MLKKLLLLLTTTLSLTAAKFNVSTTPELRTALETAAVNGEDDTIVLADGTYKTTDDSLGTFIYLSNEANKLTLQGSSADNVILSGDSIDQILNHQSTENAPMTLEKLSFIDGNNIPENHYASGGGVYTSGNIYIDFCNFRNNHVDSTIKQSHLGSGGGFISQYAQVTNSQFINNTSNGGGGAFNSVGTDVKNSYFFGNESKNGDGGAIRSYDNSIMDTCTFKNNKAVNGEGGAVSFSNGQMEINNSIFNENTAKYGGAINASPSSVNIGIILNSIFNKNSAEYGGGIYTHMRNIIVENSIFNYNISTTSGGAYYLYNNSGDYAYIVNSLFFSNSSAIGIRVGDGHKIYNNIFINNEIDIEESSAIISFLYNNYIDTSALTVSNIQKNNIFDGIELGFIDKDNGDYNLTQSSDLIDAGTTTIDDLTLPDTDLNGNSRVVGGSIDIGPYEFSSTKPTINSITYTGIEKVFNEITFLVTATTSDSRTIVSTEYSYNNDSFKGWQSSDIFTNINTHTFTTEGTHTVSVKVTDSEGEYSIKSIDINIAPLAFEDMTLNQKIASLTDDQSKIDSIMTDINGGGSNYANFDWVVDSNCSYAGSNYANFDWVVDSNCSYAGSNGFFGFEGTPPMTISSISNIEDTNIGNSALCIQPSDIDDLTSGWTLLGTKLKHLELSVFDNAKIIWIYNKDSSTPWSAYSSDTTTAQAILDNSTIGTITTIPANSGIWVLK